MAASSEYFQSIFGSNKEGNKEEFIVKNIDGPVLQEIIDYCYNGCIQLTRDNVSIILAGASALKIATLQENCVKFWKENLAPENCIRLVLEAKKRNFTEMFNESLIFLCENFENISVDQLLHLNAHYFQMIIDHDQITAPEAYIFDVMMKWVQHSKEDRLKFVGVLLECIRLEHMPTEVNLFIFIL